MKMSKSLIISPENKPCTVSVVTPIELGFSVFGLLYTASKVKHHLNREVILLNMENLYL